MNIKTLIIDNYDSFTNNLYQYIANINGELPIVVKNDEYALHELMNFEFDNIVISPGPGRPDQPDDFGVCAEVLKSVDVPILGVCLGHQGIASVFGGEIIHAPYPVHGQSYVIRHNNDILFEGIPAEFDVIRYHSLVINHANLPHCLEVTATSEDLIMGLKHKSRPIWGVQFHPESINTKYGYKIIENFMRTSQPKPKSIPSVNATSAGDSKEPDLNIKNYTLKHKKLDCLFDESQVFEKIYKDADEAIWLDSNHAESDMSRFSIMGCLGGPHAYKVEYDVNSQLVTYKQDEQDSFASMTIFDFLRTQLDKTKVKAAKLPFKFKCGFVGYFGYELYRDTLNIFPSSISDYPDAQFLFIDRAIIFDKEEKCTYLIALHDEETVSQVGSWFNVVSNLLNESLKVKKYSLSKERSSRKLHMQKDKQQYIKDINECLKYIRNGDSYEVCLTNKAVYNQKVDALNYYSALRKLSPAPFSAYLKFNNVSVCSSSMERFLSIDSNGKVETKPIKGTLPRGEDFEQDLLLIDELRCQKKFQSENLMIVDLLRHDLGGVCEVGSVKVDKLMDVESYASVHQLVSTISGKLRKDQSGIDCIKACFPGGSMVGAPKKRTVKIIDDLEKEPRGIYSGAIGYISLDGCVELSIVIRTAVISQDKLSIGVGGAIIALSDPEEEYAETLLKLKLLKEALNYVG